FQILADQIELLPRNIALVMMTKMLHMITNFFDGSLSNYWVKIKDTKQLLSFIVNQLSRRIIDSL
ncbi:hypothetical protein, partial [Lentilactobacillus buchneri]|uniref:hypothetical protein n=1 Tax=Lentilactobacillus buchneri TaxID=1581 RepID=UPI0021A5B1FC